MGYPHPLIFQRLNTRQNVLPVDSSSYIDADISYRLSFFAPVMITVTNKIMQTFLDYSLSDGVKQIVGLKNHS